MILQLNPTLPMKTPKGEGFAHFLIDYGPESDLYWTVLITSTGEIWTYANREVRAVKNITLGRALESEGTKKPPPYEGLISQEEGVGLTAALALWHAW